MILRWPLAWSLSVTATLGACATRPPAATPAAITPTTVAVGLAGAERAPTSEPSLDRDLDAIFRAPALSRALVAIHVQSLRTGRVLYARNAASRMIPGSIMKIVTAAVAADRLGWEARFETRLDVSGPVDGGVLRGDIVVVGGGDPSITAQDLRGAALFDEWADALRTSGITRVSGRLIGDDNAFDDEPLGAGWAWDYLTAGYAAPSGALSYNENVVVIRVTPGASAGESARVAIGPPGHGLVPQIEVETVAAGSASALTITRPLTSRALTIRGRIPIGSAPIVRTTTIENPSLFFTEAFRLALASRGISVDGGAWDIDEVADPPAASTRRPITRHQSAPLSSLVGYAMKASQNYYGEMLLKAIGRGTGGQAGSTERGREAVRQTLAGWSIPADALVMHDGSGLSRYNYVSAEFISSLLTRVWRDERLRGPFVAALPVGGHDGTLESRMRNSLLDRRVQAKTGTISNVRSLAGYLETDGGEKLVFTIIANHFTAPNAQVDAVMEEALERLVK